MPRPLPPGVPAPVAAVQLLPPVGLAPLPRPDVVPRLLLPGVHAPGVAVRHLLFDGPVVPGCGVVLLPWPVGPAVDGDVQPRPADEPTLLFAAVLLPVSEKRLHGPTVQRRPALLPLLPAHGVVPQLLPPGERGLSPPRGI